MKTVIKIRMMMLQEKKMRLMKLTRDLMRQIKTPLMTTLMETMVTIIFITMVKIITREKQTMTEHTRLQREHIWIYVGKWCGIMWKTLKRML